MGMVFYHSSRKMSVWTSSSGLNMEIYDLRFHTSNKTMVTAGLKVTPGLNVTAGLEELKGNRQVLASED